MNKTWIEANVTGTLTETYYEHMINITNLSTDLNYTVELEDENIYGISRLANFTVYFHDGPISKQIEISNGSVIQSSGSWYSLPASATIYVSAAVKASTLESSTVDLGLHIVAIGTTSPEIIQTVTINVN